MSMSFEVPVERERPAEGTALVGTNVPHAVRQKWMLYAAVGCLTLALVFNITAMATFSWIVGSNAGTTVSIGLTKMEVSSGDIAYETDLDSADAEAGRNALGMGVVAVLMTLFAVVAATAKTYRYEIPHYRPAILIGCFAAGVLLFVGAIVYSSKSDFLPDSNEHFGYSFALFIVAGILNVGAGALMWWILRYDQFL